MESIFFPRLIKNPDGRLRAGCYLICYTPDGPDPGVIHYDGTLRVQRVTREGVHAPNDGDYIMASGDLYAHLSDRPVTELPVGQGKAIDIPIFPRDEYRFYLCVKSVPVWSITPAGFNFVMESHSYERHHSPDRRWYSQGQFTAVMRWDLPPKGYPGDALYATGDVYEPGGKHNGTLTMAWISEYFRRAELVIHQAHGVDKVPKGWEDQFRLFDWHLKTPVIENEGQFKKNGLSAEAPWTDAQLVEVMDKVRKSQQPDEVWRYDLLFVPKIIGEERGVTLYHTEDPSCGHVRELATVAAKYQFPNEKQLAGGLYDYGNAKGKFLEEFLGDKTDLYLRTSMHELGHAMGLRHNSADNGFMTTTDELARVTNRTKGKEKKGKQEEGTEEKAKQFPGNARFKFSPGDLQRLRHWPDFLVRPGTDADGNILPAVAVPVFPDPGQDDDHAPEKREVARDVCLHALPLNDLVPLGAPVRIVYRLISLREPAEVPQKSGFKSGALTVRVTGSDGIVRTVSSMEDNEGRALMELFPWDKHRSAATLLRGDDGNPLFPRADEYKVNLEISWWNPGNESTEGENDKGEKGDKGEKDNGGVEYVVKAETRVTITPLVPDDPNTPPDSRFSSHAEAARLVLATRNVQEVLVRHSDLFKDANDALKKAMDCKVLRPHFAYLDFRVKADRARSEPKELEKAFQVLLDAHKPGSNEPIMAPHEREKALEILEDLEEAQGDAFQRVSWAGEVRKMLEDISGDDYQPDDGRGVEQNDPRTPGAARPTPIKQRPGQSSASTTSKGSENPEQPGQATSTSVEKM